MKSLYMHDLARSYRRTLSKQPTVMFCNIHGCPEAAAAKVEYDWHGARYATHVCQWHLDQLEASHESS